MKPTSIADSIIAPVAYVHISSILGHAREVKDLEEESSRSGLGRKRNQAVTLLTVSEL